MAGSIIWIKIRNSNIETRNNDQISKIQMTETFNLSARLNLSLIVWSIFGFVFWICFGFRNSKFGFISKSLRAHGFRPLDHTPLKDGFLFQVFHTQLFCQNTNYCNGEDGRDHKGRLHIKVGHVDGPTDTP